MSTKWNKAGAAIRQHQARHSIANILAGKPTRFYFEKANGSRGKRFVPVEFGDLRYEDAPYEESIHPAEDYFAQENALKGGRGAPQI